MAVYYEGMRAAEAPVEVENPFVTVRNCTTCMHRDIYVPAQHVAVGASGAQWFACQACIDRLAPSFDEPIVQHIELNRWARLHGLPEFDVRATLRRELAASAQEMDQAQAELEEA
jgi:hypothetical protein